jgi:hypothetical protein
MSAHGQQRTQKMNPSEEGFERIGRQAANQFGESAEQCRLHYFFT